MTKFNAYTAALSAEVRRAFDELRRLLGALTDRVTSLESFTNGFVVGSATGSTTEFTTTVTNITSCSVTWTAEASAKYLVLAYARTICDNSNNRYVVHLADGSNNETTRILDTARAAATGGAESPIGTAFEYITGASGSTTRKMRAQMAGGTSGNGDVTASRIIVLRVG